MAVTLRVNGNLVELPTGSTVTALLDHLAVGRAGVAVERNREIVPRRLHAETELRDGDQIEVVTLVGGGS
jgi:thiamine biosynthesis protein ThiS